MCLNSNWIKIYDKNLKLFWQVCFSTLEEKKNENLSFKNGHFFGNYINIFHKTEIQLVILRCLVCKNLNWIKSYNIILIKIFFFSCLKMHHFRASLPKWDLTPQKETSSCVFKMAIFSKFFGAFMRHIIRYSTGKKNIFLNFSLITFFNIFLCFSFEIRVYNGLNWPAVQT